MKLIGLCVLAACQLPLASSSSSGTFPSSPSASSSSPADPTLSDGRAELTPEAHYTGPASTDGGPPGGPVTDVAKDCSVAHDHCLRGSWFSSSGSNATASVQRGYLPIYQYQGKWYAWDKTLQTGGTAYSSRPATAANIQASHNRVIAWEPPDAGGTIVLPRSDKDALIDGYWRRLDISEVDASAGTIKAQSGTYPMSSARVLDDPIWIEKP